MSNIVFNPEYYKSLSLSWAELAIKDYKLMFDTPFVNEYLMVLLSHGQAVFSQFPEEFEQIWLDYFPNLSSIPAEIMDDFVCDDCMGGSRIVFGLDLREILMEDAEDLDKSF